MLAMTFDNTCTIATAFGFISNFKTFVSRGRKHFSYDLEWDQSLRSYFSLEDARTVQKSLKMAAAIEDASDFVKELQFQLANHEMSEMEVRRLYKPAMLPAE